MARYADEWNAVYQPPAKFAALSARLDELLEANGRRPDDVRRSLMTLCLFGQDEAEVKAKAAAHNISVEALRERGVITGPPNQMVEQLGRLAEAGVQRVMLQWLEQDDIDGLEALAEKVLAQL